MSLLSYKMLGNGKPVVLLHGFLENHAMWDFLIDSTEYQWILIDLPGHKDSENYYPLHSMEFMAEKVKEVLNKENIRSAFFIGHSMGGYVTVAFLELFPQMIQGLSMFFSSTLADSIEKKEQRLKAANLVMENKESFIRASIPLLFNEKKLDTLINEIQRAKDWAMETSLQGITAAILGMRERKDRTELVIDSNIPTLFLLGTYDNAVPTARIKELFSNQKHIFIHELEIGHMGQLENPENCKATLIHFLNQNYL